VEIGANAFDVAFLSAAAGQPVKNLQSSGSWPVRQGAHFPQDSSRRSLARIMGSGGMIVMDQAISMVEGGRGSTSVPSALTSPAEMAPLPDRRYQLLQILNRLAGPRERKRDVERIRAISRPCRRPPSAALGRPARTRCFPALRLLLRKSEYQATSKAGVQLRAQDVRERPHEPSPPEPANA